MTKQLLALLAAAALQGITVSFSDRNGKLLTTASLPGALIPCSDFVLDATMAELTEDEKLADILLQALRNILKNIGFKNIAYAGTNDKSAASVGDGSPAVS